MDSSESGWHYAGAANVTQQGKINVPDRVFEAEILDPRRVAYWSFERTLGFLLLSNQPLDKDRYRTQGNANVGSPEQSYRTNIPKVFFADYEGRGRGEHEQPLPEKARVEYGEKRFFAFRTEMARGDTRSCYVFTWDQFDNTIGDHEWADPLDDLPRFIAG